MSTHNRKKQKRKYQIIKMILTLIFLVLIIIFISTSFKFFKSKFLSNNKNTEIGETSKGNQINSDNDNMNDKKLKQLNYVNKKVDYFKMDYIDRYIAYKEKNPDLSDEKVVLYVNIGLDQEHYTNIQDSPNQNTNTILVNKYYSVGEDYVPEDLELIDQQYRAKDNKMTHDAALAFNEMAAAAKEEGYNIRAASTYRSYSYQDGLYTRYSEEDGVAKADTYSARPGHSEHQTGLAVDVDNVKMSYTNFGISNEFSWMKDNSYKYGYILRYTKENEFITGYTNEPWHYRYVGKEIAQKMHDENISSYEEYYFMYLDK